jgi:hypothetical protein
LEFPAAAHVQEGPTLVIETDRAQPALQPARRLSRFVLEQFAVPRGEAFDAPLLLECGPIAQFGRETQRFFAALKQQQPGECGDEGDVGRLFGAFALEDLCDFFFGI